MSKITLIKPPHVYAKFSLHYYNNGLAPIGLAYVASALKKHGHFVDVIDGVGDDIFQIIKIENSAYYIHGSDLDAIVDRISLESQYIGVSCMFSNEWPQYRYLLIKIRERFPFAFIFVGGEHATADYDYILKSNLGVDAVVIGEGEETTVQLINSIMQKAPLENIAGIAYYHKETHQVIKTAKRKRMMSFNDHLPSWELFPIRNYLEYRAGMDTYNLKVLPILASRGCPYTCTFCSSPKMWGTDYMARSPQSIVQEMIFFKKQFPDLEHFLFTDLTTTLNKQWTLELAKEITKANLGITWSIGAGTRSEVMTNEVLDALKESGYLRNTFASESGSEETLKRIKKKIRLNKLIRSMKYAVKINLPSKATFILGFPGQTLKECLQSYLFALRLAFIGLDEITIYSYAPYPGSELFDELVANQKIIRNENDPTDLRYDFLLGSIMFTGGENKSWSEHISDKWLIRFYFIFQISFVLVSFGFHPKKWVNLYTRFKNNNPITNVEKTLHFLFKNPRKNQRIEIIHKNYNFNIMLKNPETINSNIA